MHVTSQHPNSTFFWKTCMSIGFADRVFVFLPSKPNSVQELGSKQVTRAARTRILSQLLVPPFRTREKLWLRVSFSPVELVRQSDTQNGSFQQEPGQGRVVVAFKLQCLKQKRQFIQQNLNKHITHKEQNSRDDTPFCKGFPVNQQMTLTVQVTTRCTTTLPIP